MKKASKRNKKVDEIFTGTQVGMLVKSFKYELDLILKRQLEMLNTDKSYSRLDLK